jgi:hypothetical protein
VRRKRREKPIWTPAEFFAKTLQDVSRTCASQFFIGLYNRPTLAQSRAASGRDEVASGCGAGGNRCRTSSGRKEAVMPVRIFIVQGDKPIGALEAEINKWQESLGSKATVTHTSTAMTEHKDEDKGWQTRLMVTIWYEL